MARGGRRPGAGRKPKSAAQRLLGGNAGKRPLTLVPPRPVLPEASVPDAAALDTVGGLVLPMDRLAQEDEQAYWHLYLPAAVANGTLTPHSVGGFILLCQIAARADRLWEDIEREGLTSLTEGGMRPHPLLPAYRGLVQRHESLLQRYLLAAMAKPATTGAPKSEKESDDSAVLRQLMALQ